MDRQTQLKVNLICLAHSIPPRVRLNRSREVVYSGPRLRSLHRREAYLGRRNQRRVGDCLGAHSNRNKLGACLAARSSQLRREAYSAHLSQRRLEGCLDRQHHSRQVDFLANPKTNSKIPNKGADSLET